MAGEAAGPVNAYIGVLVRIHLLYCIVQYWLLSVLLRVNMSSAGETSGVLSIGFSCLMIAKVSIAVRFVGSMVPFERHCQYQSGEAEYRRDLSPRHHTNCTQITGRLMKLYCSSYEILNPPNRNQESVLYIPMPQKPASYQSQIVS